jgi:hypothetical protein
MRRCRCTPRWPFGQRVTLDPVTLDEGHFGCHRRRRTRAGRPRTHRGTAVSAGTAERVAAAMRVALSAAPPAIGVAGGTSDLVAGWYRRPSGDGIALVVLDDDVSVPSVVDLLTDSLNPVGDAVTGADVQAGDLFALAEAFADLIEAPTMLVETSRTPHRAAGSIGAHGYRCAREELIPRSGDTEARINGAIWSPAHNAPVKRRDARLRDAP